MSDFGDCTYCRRKMDPPGTPSLLERTADHVMPAWMRRGNRYGLASHETVACCWHCNGLKGQMSPGQWETFMAAHPRWWERPEFQRSRRLPGQVKLRRAADTPWMRRALAEFQAKK